MSVVTNLFRVATPNRGDLASGPYQYFRELKANKLELTGWKSDVDSVRAAWEATVSSSKLIIVGGGGIIEFEKHRDSIEKIRAHNGKSKRVIWGAGHNSKIGYSGYKGDYSGFDLVGVRDNISPFEWVPCASCMSPLFDKSYEVTKEVIYFVNKGGDYLRYLPSGVSESEVIGNMKTSMEQIIDTLAAAETVVTSSYHGVYWATLLGRKVVAIPTSSKFYDFRHPVPLGTRFDWRNNMRFARSYPDALAECRAANISFKNRVMDLIN